MIPVISPELNHRFFVKNRLKLKGKLPGLSLAFFCAADEMPRNGDQYYPYRQNSDFFYLTGILQPSSVLLMAPHHPVEQFREILFIEKPDPHREIWLGKKLSKENASEISGIEEIHWLEELGQLLPQIIYPIDTLWFNLPEYSKFKPEVKSRDERFLHRILEQYPAHTTGRLSPIMREIRVRKEPEEIAVIRKACTITAEAVQSITPLIRPGVYEHQIEAELFYVFQKNGASHAFEPIIASGKNACTLHYTSNHSQCKEGELILLDIGAEYSCYASDCSRTFPVSASFNQRQKDLYDSVYRIFLEAGKLIQPGKTLKKINEELHPLIEEEHTRLGLYSKEESKNQDPENPLYKKFSLHGVSHFIGLDVHDPGDLNLPLEPGMVISCEPGIYIPAENIGIRIENTLLITENGPDDLMKNIPFLK